MCFSAGFRVVYFPLQCFCGVFVPGGILGGSRRSCSFKVDLAFAPCSAFPDPGLAFLFPVVFRAARSLFRGLRSCSRRSCSFMVVTVPGGVLSFQRVPGHVPRLPVRSLFPARSPAFPGVPGACLPSFLLPYYHTIKAYWFAFYSNTNVSEAFLKKD